MRIEKNRHLIILKELIKRTDQFCSSEYLSQKAMVSVRTIKSDIQSLNFLLSEDQSACIRSIKSKGYKIVPLELKKYSFLCETINVYQIIFRTQSIEKTNRRLFILQTLLSEPYVKIDDLADALYVSRSSLKEDMTWVKKFVRSFHLEIKSSPGKGLGIQGKEQDIRSAMLEVISSQYHDIDFMYPVESFYNWFHLEWYDDIRHEILKVIRESKITISDIGGKKLATYLCLCEKRNSSEHNLDSTPEEIEGWKQTYEYSLAERFFTLPTIRKNLTQSESETANIARMLRVIRDINLRNPEERETLDQEVIDTSYQMLDDFVEDAKINNSYFFFQSESFKGAKDNFASILVRVFNQKRYDYTNQKRLITYTEIDENNYSPLALEYTRILVEFIQRNIQSEIAVSDVRAFSGIFHHLLNLVPIQYKKQRLAIFSMEGRSVAEMMKEELNHLYGRYIEKADVYNLYEMRRINFEDYDAAIASWNVAYYVYPIPLVTYAGSQYQEDRGILFDNLFVSGYPMEPLYYLRLSIKFYTKAKIKSYMQFIEEQAKRFGKNDEHIRSIITKLTKRFESLSYYNPISGISVIFLDYEDTGMDVFEVYEPTDTVFWGSSLEIRYFIVVSLKPRENLSYIRIVHQFLQTIFCNREDVDRMKEDMDQAIEDIYIKVLKNFFI